MKQRFNKKGSQTYASREEELKAHAKKIDDLLRTPKNPGVHLTPTGQVRTNGSKYAHDSLRQKRIDLSIELDQIRKEKAKRHNTYTQRKAKGL